MKTIMAKNPNDSFSFSRRYFNFKKKVEDELDDDMEEILRTSSLGCEEELKLDLDLSLSIHTLPIKPPKKHSSPVSRLIKSAFSFGTKSGNRARFSGLGTKVVGTLFGYRRGHVHFAFQEDPKLNPAFLVELATPTSILVREMASGLVRIALECDRKPNEKKSSSKPLLEEPIWRTYCNGRKCGYATRRECGADEWKVLNAVGPITMGAGVLPGAPDGDGAEGELMYMRAKFERVVGSRDSEAFYMMNPDGHGGPELSIYLLRV
ncbi:OLC1v1032419C1 [Oldenlandia corymbosa var. corymbosa]|uniref:OLC1v1032419C1 n=1 Tax=Oldenlandia corymbosa var. corymbosa TaxID=529605 RepID=A0AAV1CKZ6_OLDCO|nr:OLC1v1032419C1 [Oldenlandia corymbosa var. corymbosa]